MRRTLLTIGLTVLATSAFWIGVFSDRHTQDPPTPTPVAIAEVGTPTPLPDCNHILDNLLGWERYYNSLDPSPRGGAGIPIADAERMIASATATATTARGAVDGWRNVYLQNCPGH